MSSASKSHLLSGFAPLWYLQTLFSLVHRRTMASFKANKIYKATMLVSSNCIIGLINRKRRLRSDGGEGNGANEEAFWVGKTEVGAAEREDRLDVEKEDAVGESDSMEEGG